MRSNYAAKISVVIPFVSAGVAVLAARSARLGIFPSVLCGLGGFLVGFAFGALSVGLSDVLLSLHGRRTSSMSIISLGAAYVIVPLVLLLASCAVTVIALKWIL